MWLVFLLRLEAAMESYLSPHPPLSLPPKPLLPPLLLPLLLPSISITELARPFVLHEHEHITYLPECVVLFM